MSERGAISLVTLAGALAMCGFALVAADLGSVLVARARSQAAADAAALAAVARQAPVLAVEGDPADAAREVAERNGATLLVCRCDVGSPWAEVEVEVRASARTIRAWDGRAVRARAIAELDADVLTYRDGG